MQRKGVIAFGFLVGVAIVAGMLRVKFYFDPPENNFSTEMADLFIPVDETVVTTTATFTATPQVVDTVQYALTQQYDLGDGIVLAVLTTADRIWTIQLQGSELVSQAYDLAWVPLADSRHVLQTGVQLIAGLPPQVVLTETNTGYRVGQTMAQSDSVYDVALRTYSTDWVEQSSVVLQDDLSVINSIILQIVNDDIWLLLNADSISLYSVTGQLRSTQTLTSADSAVCDIIPDQSNIILVLESNTMMTVQKHSPYGAILQAVSFPRPDELVRCQAVKRVQEQFVVQLVDRIVPYADNLSEQYAPIVLTSTQWFPVIALQGDTLWLIYSMSTTLGQYHSHVQVYKISR